MARLKSCKYCGKIHSGICEEKPQNNRKKGTNADRFRWTKDWQTKRDDIRERDNQLCQVCIRKLYGTLNQFTYDDLSVHHIEPLHERWDRRMDDYNLITVCLYHHEMAERGEIPRSVLLAIVNDQEDKREESPQGLVY
jgi:hypothetical protein